MVKFGQHQLDKLTLGAQVKHMGVEEKEEKERKIKELDWAQAQLTKSNLFWAFRNSLAQDPVGPKSGNSRPKPKPNMLCTPEPVEPSLKLNEQFLPQTLLILSCVNLFN